MAKVTVREQRIGSMLANRSKRVGDVGATLTLALVSDDTELFKQVCDNEGSKRRLPEVALRSTYEESA